MRERVVLKWGGGLITEKDRFKTVREDVMDHLAQQLEQVLAHGVDVLLVHGAGSFGHLKAKEYRLAEGHLEHPTFSGQLTQQEAIAEVRQDMLELNEHVLRALTKFDISAVSLAPHLWARNTGPSFDGDLSLFEDAPRGIVMVTHGDVVDCDEPQQFGILSGDDLVVRLATELSGVKRLVFAMGGVEGVLSQPPSNTTEPILIERLTEHHLFEGEHAVEMDVTGGIGLKVNRGFMVHNAGVDVLLVSGEHEHRVAQACLGEAVRGTKLAS